MTERADGAGRSAATGAVPLEPLEWHPCLPNLSHDELLWLADQPDGAATYAQFAANRARLLQRAEEDPLYHGFELDCWELNDEQLADPDVEVLPIFGWNRGAGKTYWAVRCLCQAARQYPGYEGLLLAETDDNSVGIHHRLVWWYLKKYIGRLNGKRHVEYKVNYSHANGFTEGLLVIPSGPIYSETRTVEEGPSERVLPAGGGRVETAGGLPVGERKRRMEIIGYRGHSIIQFKSYKADHGQFEGREFGARLPVIGRTAAGNAILDLARRPDGTKIENVAVVADEGMTLGWFRMLARRVPYRKGKILWPYTPKDGMIPSIKAVVGAATFERTAPVNTGGEFGNFVANVPGCPRGHMPVLATCEWPRAKAIWHHWSRQSFNDYSNQVRKDCQGKTSEYVERFAFGYARTGVALQFPNFGSWNIIEEEELPEVGTEFMIVDWHDKKPPFIIYGRVGAGSEPAHYVWYDWPDAQMYGEWAVESERETSEEHRAGWDGDPGPAQNCLGHGIVDLKKLFAKIETVLPDGPVERDPKRRLLQLEAIRLGRPVRMEIFYRLIDSRAGPRPRTAEAGETCIMWDFAKEHVDADTGQVWGGIHFEPTKGNEIDLTHVRTLLEYRRNDEGQILVPPRLKVTSRCRQVIWAMRNYTSWSGQSGACKDPIDTVHYMARHELVHVDPRTFGSRGGGSY